MTVPPEGRLLVDAANVIGSRPDGWWRDRTGAVQRLLAALQPLAAHRRGPVVVVVEGRVTEAVSAGRHSDVEVVHATRRGRDAADDRIVALVGDPAAPARRGDGEGDDLWPAQRGGAPDIVVTADRELIDRVTELGAMVLGPRTLLRTLDGDT